MLLQHWRFLLLQKLSQDNVRTIEYNILLFLHQPSLNFFLLFESVIFECENLLLFEFFVDPLSFPQHVFYSGHGFAHLIIECYIVRKFMNGGYTEKYLAIPRRIFNRFLGCS